MGNYVIAGVGNYVIENPSNLGNYVIADRRTWVSDSWCLGVRPAQHVSFDAEANRVMSPISATRTAPRVRAPDMASFFVWGHSLWVIYLLHDVA